MEAWRGGRGRGVNSRFRRKNPRKVGKRKRRNICSKDFFFKLKMPINQFGTYRRLYAANGSPLNVLGDVHVPIDIGGVLVITRILVIENLGNPIILGLGFLQENK